MISEARRLAMRRAHAKHENYCTCGKIVHGNGGAASHKAMHMRKGEVHHYMTYTAWRDQTSLGARS